MKKFSLVVFVISFLLVVTGGVWGESTLDVVKKRGKLIAGIRFDSPPMGYLNKNNESAGLEVDLIKAIAKELKVDIELVQVTSKTRIPMLLNGNIDLFAATANHTKKRDEVIDYSVTYYIGGNKILVRSDSKVKDWRELDGKTIAVVQGAQNQKMLKILYKNPTTYLTFQEKPQAVMAVKNKKADAFSNDDVSLYGFAKNDPSVKVVGSDIYKSWFGLGIRENDSDWRDAINFAIVELYKSGEFARIFKKNIGRDLYFEVEAWVD